MKEKKSKMVANTMDSSVSADVPEGLGLAAPLVACDVHRLLLQWPLQFPGENSQGAGTGVDRGRGWRRAVLCW